MPSTVNKILLPGSDIITTSETAIGLLLEDAQEAKIKIYIYYCYRENYSRKF